MGTVWLLLRLQVTSAQREWSSYYQERKICPSVITVYFCKLSIKIRPKVIGIKTQSSTGWKFKSGFEPVQKIGVNPMTLKALVRERLENGQDVPTELFKPFEGNQTKITRRN